MREKSRRPSPLQRRVLIVLAALDAKRPGPVATRDIERVLEQGGDAPVYGPNLRMLPAPARLLHVLRDADPLTAATYEEDTVAALADLLARAGVTDDQAQELQWHRIRWPLMSQEEADRRELNSLLDELEQRQLYCNRGQLTEIVFSPVRKPGERWTERLQWLLMTDGFGFRSPLSREAASRALAILAGYTGREVAEHLATVMVWNDAEAGERP
ncbi:Uncharacterised protein [Klebsiella pneumoniae]|nr:Uncharacterised protein [Klebsiella pneumoniae]